jgi:hypothetical protein
MHNISMFETARSYFKEKDLKNISNCFSDFLIFFKESEYLYDKTFFHPLGFVYTELFEFENRDTIRINIWDTVRHYQEPLMEIHNHFYNLNSFIIKGKMINNLYKTNPNENPNYAIYMGTYNQTSGRTLKKTEKKLNVQLEKIQEINQNEIYNISPDRLHSSFVPIEQFTCSFVYASERGTPTSMILGPIDGLNEYYYHNKLVDKKVIDEIFEKIV